MNIAIITTSLNGGGAERIAGLLSKELEKTNTVYLFVLNTDNIVYEYGGTIINIGLSGPFYDYPIKLYKEKYKIDVAISFLEIMNFANIRTRGKERIIISERSVQSRVNPPLTAQTQKIKRYYPWADEIVACSYGVEYDLRENYGITTNITSIYNFIDKENILCSANTSLPEDVKRFLNNSPFFLNVGRLHEQKNQKRLINQFSIFHEKNRNIKMIILGSGELEMELNTLIESKGLADNVRIIPYLKNPFVYMINAEALIVSSHYEGLPNVIVEAMTLGCPIISTDCLAGPRELLDDINDYELCISNNIIGARGILVPDFESEDTVKSHFMADAMELLCENHLLKERLTYNQKVYMSKYSNEALLEQWIQVIERASRNDKNVVLDEFNMLKQERKTYIYGAGYVGLSCYFRLKDNYEIAGFVVTHKNNSRNNCFGIPICEICEMNFNNNDVQFIMGVGDESQDEVLRTLNQFGYDNIIYPSIFPFEYDYYLNNRFDLKKELVNWYRIKTGLDIDIDNPITFNEKIQWLKLYDNLPIKKILADKIQVRKYVEEKIGSQYLIPILGVWENYDKINFEMLPKQFVLKCNTGSGYNIIVYDKNTIDHKLCKQKFDEWQNVKYEYKSGLEMHYAGIEPKILAESLLTTESGEDLRDYKVFVFNGVAKLIQVDIDRHHAHKRNLYTPNWEYIPCSILYPTDSSVEVEKPKCLVEMLSIAQKLAKEFIHARVDFYITGNRLFFGEITFTHGSGTEKFTPPEFAVEMGNWMKIKEN